MLPFRHFLLASFGRALILLDFFLFLGSWFGLHWRKRNW